MRHAMSQENGTPANVNKALNRPGFIVASTPHASLLAG